jgi:CRISPR system Cascade subunit CasE
MATLLVPESADAQTDASHRLTWALFGDDPDRQRDFLWRQDKPGEFMALSARQPNALGDIFNIETKPFRPNISAGDRLRFMLRAHPTTSQPSPLQQGKGKRGKRVDVVVQALRDLRGNEADAGRLQAVEAAACAWLRRKGEARGFIVTDDLVVHGFEKIQVPRRNSNPIVFNAVDFEGVIEVTNPQEFLTALASGFGRSRAFGCGLMLIKRDN